jgi:hypothetical protein
MAGFLDLIGKIGNWLLPNKEEYRRNKIASLRREQSDLLKQPCTSANATRLDIIAVQLRNLQDQSNNA